MAWKLRKDKLKSDEPEAQNPGAPLAETVQTPAESTSATFEHLGAPLGYDLSANVAPAAEPTYASENADEPTFVDETLPQFAEEGLPHFAEDMPTFNSPVESDAAPVEDEPIVLGEAPDFEPLKFAEPEEKEPISLGAFTPYQPPSTPASDFGIEPVPEFDPVVAPSTPTLEPEAIAIAPPDVETVEPTALPVEEQTVPAEDPIAPVEEPVAPVEEPLTFAEEPVTFGEEDSVAAAPFDVSPQREAVAPGLVTTESDTGMPRVAPFILDAPDTVEPDDTDRMHHVVLRIGNLSASYFLVKDVTTIGRPDSAVQNYPDIEVELDDGVSRRHAEIRRQNDQFYVVDKDSTNGTILNGEMLTPEMPVPLHTGDRIRIGERTEMLFE